MKQVSCGIDFGTSNSTCAVVTPENIDLVKLEKDHETMPSAIFYSADKEVFFGRDAISLYVRGKKAD